jgi:hypothetical protein
MARPIYETKSDRQNEKTIASYLEKRWGCEADKLKIACEIDYSLTRGGKIVGVMEIKCRKYDYNTLEGWGGLILSAHKWQAAKRWKETHNITFILAVGLLDGIFVLLVRASDNWPQLELVTGGRTDRSDPQDIEPCVLIPMKLFNKMKEKKDD